MIFLFLFIFQLTVLFILSKKVQQDISRLFYKITKSKKPAVYIFALLFLPGTYLHELSHLIFSLFLFVPVGKLELMPTYSEGYLKLGSVTIGKTDSVRRFVIGIAPLIVGLSVLMAVVAFAIQDATNRNWWEYCLYLYLVFTVSNTMFMSKRDLEGGWKIFVALFVIILLMYLVGIRASVSGDSFLYSTGFNNIFMTANKYLLFPLTLDFVIVMFGNILKK